jgi:hypothetical protein
MLILLKTRNQIRYKSPWSPWFAFSFAIIAISLGIKTINSDQNLLINLGYSLRALVFFLISAVVAVLATVGRPMLARVLFPTILIAFTINTYHVISGGISGSNAFIADANGEIDQLYGPGIIGEPNPLAAGIFFVYILVFLMQWNTTTWKQQALLLVGFSLILASIFFINNRSAMIMAGVALIIYVWKSARNRNFTMATIVGSFIVISSFAYAFLTDRGPITEFGAMMTIGRIPQWQSNLDLIQLNPIFGWQLGSHEAHHAFFRLWGEWGIPATLAFLIFLLTVLIRKPNSQIFAPTDNFFTNDFWVKTLKLFVFLLLVGGLTTDSLTPVLSWDLLAMSVGIAWGTWCVNSQKCNQEYVSSESA